jgi:hypothetical protein
MSSNNQYHFVTHWQIPGEITQVADILSDAEDFVRWWPSVYLRIVELEPGDEHSVGKVLDLYTKGWLPYTLRWQCRITSSNRPYGFALDAWGDFVGAGIWTLAQEGDIVHVTYDWRVAADKPLLKRLSFLMRPIFSANHRWAMAKGEQSLKLELARRNASTPAEQARIPAPPRATWVLRWG